jgi:hypothetical protein
MALLGEEVVEEWLNRQGYFTIRGIKIGVNEIDILAFKPNLDGHHECRHIEVQISNNPIAYISKVPKEIQKARGIGPDNAKERTSDELKQGIKEWIKKKFDHPEKIKLRERLFPGDWSRELVVNIVKHPDELELFRDMGVKIIQLEDVVQEMNTTTLLITSAAGGDLLNLMQLGRSKDISMEQANDTGEVSQSETA